MPKLCARIWMEAGDKHDLSEARYQASSLSIKIGDYVELAQIDEVLQDFDPSPINFNFHLIAAFDKGEEVPLPHEQMEIEESPDTIREQVQTLPLA